MTLTPSNRARVVELLRCAADLLQRKDLVAKGVFLAPIWIAALRIYEKPPEHIYQAALDARDQLFWMDEDRAIRFLEAARRVEGKSWP